MMLQPLFLEGPSLKEENQGGGDIEDADIDPVGGLA